MSLLLLVAVSLAANGAVDDPHYDASMCQMPFRYPFFPGDDGMPHGLPIPRPLSLDYGLELRLKQDDRDINYNHQAVAVADDTSMCQAASFLHGVDVNVFHGADETIDIFNVSMFQTSYFPCGANVNVPYPFFLGDYESIESSGDDKPYIPGFVGFTGDECRDCRNHHLSGLIELRLRGRNLTVLDIDYDNHTATVTDADALDAGDCPRVTHNVTIPEEPWLTLSTTANVNLVFFFDCVFTAAGIPKPPPPSLPPINCSGFPERDGTSSFVVVATELDLRLPRDELARACNQVVITPVLRYWLPEYFPRLNDDGYGKLLKKGFQLTWDQHCYECQDSGGKCSYNQIGEFLDCVCSDGRVRNPGCMRSSGHSKKKKIVPISISSVARPKKKTATYTVSAVSGAIALFLLLSASALYYKKSRGGRTKQTPSIESFLQKHESQHPKRDNYSDLKRMTKSFSHKLGQGGFGTVFKGNLPNGRPIAVKLLKNSKDDGQEFMNEVTSTMRTSHVNVVALLGYCLHRSKGALIHEYMPNGSLERFSFGQDPEGENSLSWEKLLDIAVGIARGLEYLHRGCSTRIVRFDIKPHNILLDQDFCPKISDFGLAKLCMTKESIISIDGARGTIGYIAPEVFSQRFGQISSKSDVYSYGMVILELTGERRNINTNSETSSKYFPQWIYEHLAEHTGHAGEIVGVDTELVRKLIIVGLWCIQLQPSNRPSMTRVIEMLESRANDLEIPPQSLLC